MTVENCFNKNYTELSKVYFRAKMFRFSFYISFVHVHGIMHVPVHAQASGLQVRLAKGGNES